MLRAVLSRWIHNKIRLLLTIRTCLRRLNWGDCHFINTRTFSLPAIQTHTQKQTCNEQILYQALSPSFIKRQKIALCRDRQCSQPSQKPICFTCERRILQDLQILRDKSHPSLRGSRSCALFWRLWSFALHDFTGEGTFLLWQKMSLCFLAASSDSGAHGCPWSSSWKVYLKDLLPLKTISKQGLIYVASWD